MSTGAIDQLQLDVVTQIKTETALSAIDVLDEQTKDIESSIEIALGKVKGLCIVVTPPVCSGAGQLPGPYFNDVQFDVNVVENPVLNSTGMTASYVAELCAKKLHRFITTHKRCLLVGAIRPVADPQYRAYKLPVKTSLGL
jgi:hypothetical protein